MNTPIIGKKRGYFISFEGADGSGKGTQVGLLKKALEMFHFTVDVVRAPGGSQIGEDIRKIVKNLKNKAMTKQTELLLMCAATGQSAHELIKPALNEGHIVIADRYYHSTVVYQGFGRQLDPTFIKAAIQFSHGDVMPDVTFCLYVDEVEAKKRRTHRGKVDRFEREDDAFQERIQLGYDWLRKQEPTSNGKIIGLDARGTVEEIHTEIYKCVAARISMLDGDQLIKGSKLII